MYILMIARGYPTEEDPHGDALNKIKLKHYVIMVTKLLFLVLIAVFYGNSEK